MEFLNVKTKNKEIKRANHKEHSQSNEPINTRSVLAAGGRRGKKLRKRCKTKATSNFSDNHQMLRKT